MGSYFGISQPRLRGNPLSGGQSSSTVMKSNCTHTRSCLGSCSHEGIFREGEILSQVVYDELNDESDVLCWVWWLRNLGCCSYTYSILYMLMVWALVIWKYTVVVCLGTSETLEWYNESWRLGDTWVVMLFWWPVVYGWCGFWWPRWK